VAPDRPAIAGGPPALCHDWIVDTGEPRSVPGGTRWDFFVSYTAADQAWAEWIVWQLEAAGYQVLVQAWNMVAGSNWSAAMQDGIRYATRTIAVLSDAYLTSVYGRQEWETATLADPEGMARKLLPVRIEDCDRPGLLGRVVSLDLFGLGAQDAHDRLLFAVRAAVVGRAKPAYEPAFPGPAVAPIPPQASPARSAPAFPGSGHTGTPAARPRQGSARPAPSGPQGGPSGQSGGPIFVGGDVIGQIVVGHHSVVVHAESTSVVTVAGSLPPTPRRRPVGTRPPRRGIEPVGRDAELAMINSWLDRRMPVEIYGELGIGKTTLLRKVAAERSAAMDVAFLSAAALSVDDLLQDIFEVFYDAEGYRPDPSRLRRLLGSVEALLVLDDFDGSAEDLTAVLDMVASCDVLVAGVERHLLGEGRAMALGGLDEDAARTLLVRNLGRKLTGDEAAAAARLWTSARGNPRVLVNAVAAIRSSPENALTLDAAESTLAPFLARRLTDDARRTVRIFAALKDIPGAGPTLVTAVGGTMAGVDELLAAGLIEDSGSGYRLSGSLGWSVAQLAGDPPSPVELAASLVRWAESAPPTDVAKAAPILMHVLRQAKDADAPAAAVSLARVAAPRLALESHWDAWAQMLALGRAAAQAAGAQADKAEAYFRNEEDSRRRVWDATATRPVGAAAGGVAVGGDVAVIGTWVPSRPYPSHALRPVTVAAGDKRRLWHAFIDGFVRSLTIFTEGGAMPRRRRSAWARLDARIHDAYNRLGPPPGFAGEDETLSAGRGQVP
jgi:hypothetical protein